MISHIPDWVSENTSIYIFAGVEQFAKRVDGIWYKKTVRCQKCGKCCSRIKCGHLKESGTEFLCSLGVNIPFGCARGDGFEDECSIVWETI